MGMFDNIFGNAPQTPTPAPAQTPAGVQPPTPSPATPATPDAFNPNHTTDPKSTATPAAPLAEFGDLFKVDEKAEGTEEAPFTWNYDKEKLEASVGNLTFVNPAEITEVAASLGIQNTEAFAGFMNNFGRTLYMQSLLVNSKMSEQTVNIAEQRFGNKVPSYIRNSMVNNEIQTQDTNATNPALAPVVALVSAQIAQKNPNFTPEQVAAHTKAYMSQVAQAYAPKPTTTSQNTLNAPADFSGFFK
jgi:hypothetical protein